MPKQLPEVQWEHACCGWRVCYFRDYQCAIACCCEQCCCMTEFRRPGPSGSTSSSLLVAQRSVVGSQEISSAPKAGPASKITPSPAKKPFRSVHASLQAAGAHLSNSCSQSMPLAIRSKQLLACVRRLEEVAVGHPDEVDAEQWQLCASLGQSVRRGATALHKLPNHESVEKELLLTKGILKHCCEAAGAALQRALAPAREEGRGMGREPANAVGRPGWREDAEEDGLVVVGRGPTSRDVRPTSVEPEGVESGSSAPGAWQRGGASGAAHKPREEGEWVEESAAGCSWGEAGGSPHEGAEAGLGGTRAARRVVVLDGMAFPREPGNHASHQQRTSPAEPSRVESTQMHLEKGAQDTASVESEGPRHGGGAACGAPALSRQAGASADAEAAPRAGAGESSSSPSVPHPPPAPLREGKKREREKSPPGLAAQAWAPPTDPRLLRARAEAAAADDLPPASTEVPPPGQEASEAALPDRAACSPAEAQGAVLKMAVASEQARKMLSSGRLCLVVDLDLTLVNSVTREEVEASGGPEAAQGLDARAAAFEKAEQEWRPGQPPVPSPLWRLDEQSMWTKLRPGARALLEAAAPRFVLWVHTNARADYAAAVLRRLDPGGALFGDRVIAQGADLAKGLHARGLAGLEAVALVLDDNAAVWPEHPLNVLLVEPYHYFEASRRRAHLAGPSLEAIRADEDECQGMLACALRVLCEAHARVMRALRAPPKLTPEGGKAWRNWDVRAALAAERATVLEGITLAFSAVLPRDFPEPERHPLWSLARAFGADVRRELTGECSHLVCASGATAKAALARRMGVCVVSVEWLRASVTLWKRARESAYPAKNHYGGP